MVIFIFLAPTVTSTVFLLNSKVIQYPQLPIMQEKGLRMFNKPLNLHLLLSLLLLKTQVLFGGYQV